MVNQKEFIEKFRNYLEINGMANRTIISYTNAVKHYIKTIGNIDEVTKESIDKFLLTISQTRKKSTRNLYLSSLISLVRFLGLNIKLPKFIRVEQTIPVSISEQFFLKEIVPLIEFKFQTPIKVRAILYFMFYTGVRMGEVPLIKRSDIDFETRLVKVNNKKTNKEKIVIMTDIVKEFVQKYFFLEAETKNAFNTSENGIRKIFDKLKPYFPDVNLHAHLFRSSMATHLRKKGMDVTEIQKLMGHSSIESTLRYLDSNIDNIKEKFDKRVNG